MRRNFLYIFVFICLMVSCICIAQKSYAKALSEHKIYSEKICDKRIKEIQNYYYKKQNKLTTINRKWSWNTGKGTICFYFHGRDLLFGFGTDQTGNEYRLYFYQNQLIRMLVDEKGKRRKTYKQLYKRTPDTDTYIPMWSYLEFETYGRREAALKKKAQEKILTNASVRITKVKGNVIYYHKLYAAGPDGYVQWIGTQLYKAKMDRNVVVTEWESPDVPSRRSKGWLNKIINTGYLSGYNADLKKSGKTVSKIEGIYFP